MNKLRPVTRYFTTLVFFGISNLLLYAQGNDRPAEISLSLITGNTPSLEVQRNYQLPELGQKDITTNSSSLFALRVNYSRKISSHFSWDVGLEGGINSCNFCLGFEEDFVNLSFDQPFFTENTEYDLPYAAAILGVKYTSSITLRSHLAFKVGMRASYYIPIIMDLLISAPLESGQFATIFSSQISNNSANEVIFSPDLSIDYLLRFPQSRFSLLAGMNTSFSRKYFMHGTFQLHGDQETLSGRFSKKMIMLNLNLGLAYRMSR